MTFCFCRFSNLFVFFLQSTENPFFFSKEFFFFLLMWWLLHMIFSDVLASLLLAITALFARFQEYNNRSRRDGGCIFLTFFCSFWRLYSNSHDQALFSFLLIFFFFFFLFFVKVFLFLVKKGYYKWFVREQQNKKGPYKKMQKRKFKAKVWINYRKYF